MAIKLSDIDFSTTTSLAIPQGNVIKITKNGNVVVWEKPTTDTGIEVGSLSVGTIVKLNVNGAPRNFIIVHQGNPDSSVYDSSCDGTWMLMEDIYEKRALDSAYNTYPNSATHTYLNNTFINLFDSDIQNAIKQVKLPYAQKSTTVVTGSDGAPAKVFLLSYIEMGFPNSSSVTSEGAVLDHFKSVPHAKRIAYFDGAATPWWIRSLYRGVMGGNIHISASGLYENCSYTNIFGIRPAMILDSSFGIPLESFN